MLFPYIETQDEFEFYTRELFMNVGKGAAKIPEHKVYSLRDAAQAHIVSSSSSSLLLYSRLCGNKVKC